MGRTQSREYTVKAVGTKDEGKPVVGQASSDIPALKPYWGKPAVRNFRGGDGNVGIIEAGETCGMSQLWPVEISQ